MYNKMSSARVVAYIDGVLGVEMTLRSRLEALPHKVVSNSLTSRSFFIMLQRSLFSLSLSLSLSLLLLSMQTIHALNRDGHFVYSIPMLISVPLIRTFIDD